MEKSVDALSAGGRSRTKEPKKVLDHHRSRSISNDGASAGGILMAPSENHWRSDRRLWQTSSSYWRPARGN